MTSQSINSVRKVRVGRYPLLRKLLVGFIVISLLNLVISYFLYTPKIFSIDNENRELVIKYNILQDRIRSLESKIDDIHHRDISVYRSLFSVDTLAIEGIYTPYAESKYATLQGDEYSTLMTDSWKSIDNLARKAYATTLSLDQLQILAKNKERMSFAIPAIWPIDRTQLEWFYSFGMRARHPIYKTRKMHKGVDMSCKRGVPVYATGDAIVQMTDEGMRRRGYGRQILLNHEFGYQTRYAHLNKILVKEGERVTRGQLIGEVGSTGGSTGPHLHYEVIYMGRHVNPVNYFNRNMSSDEYKQLMDKMKHNTDLEVE
ncbi:MAG: M23 family metallopeptidase [Alistipes sp.]|nr:M23 family metallopeptidase [Alistipes sp.]MBQ6583683.1 M23 family metallopeptidase [Alistipes sp.]